MVYLDHAATSPLHPDALVEMRRSWETTVGNASSIHSAGVASSTAVERARAELAGHLSARSEDLYFTSGGTESNNLALKGFAGSGNVGHLVVSSIEHPSVLASADWMSGHGWTVTRLPVDKWGMVSADALSAVITSRTALVSIMHANNEVGVVQDVATIGAVCRSRGVPFHIDASQSFTKLPLDVANLPVDMITLSAHKLGGPKGVGALWVRRGLALQPLLHGGGQEGGMRSGTLPTDLIVGFAAAARISLGVDWAQVGMARDRLVSRVLESIPGTSVNTPTTHSLPGHAHFTFVGVDGKRVLFALDRAGFVVSVGSACSSGKKIPSHVLTAMGRTSSEASAAVRVTLGPRTTESELEDFSVALADIIRQERSGDAG